MADPTNSTFTTLNPGVNGDAMDETAAAFDVPPTIRKKPRVVIGSNTDKNAFADPLATPPVGNEFALPVRQVGPVESTPAASATSGRSQVAGSAASVTLLNANANRLGATVYNDSTSALYLGFGAVAVTSASFDVKVLPGGYFELPFQWVGVVSGVWDVAVGFARVAELT